MAKKPRGAKARWAVVPTGAETCGYCMMLASRGFVYTSKKAAQTSVHHFHLNCDCKIIVEFSDDPALEGYSPEHYYKKWLDTQGVESPDQYQEFIVEKLKQKGISASNRQIGKKIGKHASDWNLDVSNPDDRSRLLYIIDRIVEDYTELVYNIEWRGRGTQYCAFIREADAVLIDRKNRFVTVLKEGGVNNARIISARNKGFTNSR